MRWAVVSIIVSGDGRYVVVRERARSRTYRWNYRVLDTETHQVASRAIYHDLAAAQRCAAKMYDSSKNVRGGEQ